MLFMLTSVGPFIVFYGFSLKTQNKMNSRIIIILAY